MKIITIHIHFYENAQATLGQEKLLTKKKIQGED